MMKRLLAAVLLLAAVMMLVTACGGGVLGTCELCGEENVEVREVSAMGVSGQFCDNCYDTAKTYAELAGANA